MIKEIVQQNQLIEKDYYVILVHAVQLGLPCTVGLAPDEQIIEMVKQAQNLFNTAVLTADN